MSLSLVFGCDIWKSGQAGAVVQAMKTIIDDGIDVAQAMGLAGFTE